MLDIRMTIENGRVVLHNLEGAADAVPGAVRRGLAKIAQGVHGEAFERLSGPGRKRIRLKNTRGKDGKVKRKTRARGQADMLGGRPGSYPVPVMTGNLRRLLDWVKPGESKTVYGNAFAAGPLEAVVFDSAEYALNIFNGTGSSAKFGPRPALTDALEAFGQGERMVRTVEGEIAVELGKRGL